MKNITITLNHKQFTLVCDEESELLLNNLVPKLNEQISKLKKSNNSASFELLLVLCALNLQDKIENIEKQIVAMQDSKNEQNNTHNEGLTKYIQDVINKINSYT
ncbi:MAG: cell division protein ZapA [Rickettsiaceae bacterium]